MLQADPAPLQALAGPEHPLRLVNGRAIVGILIQRCPVWRINGHDIGPSDEIHVWTALEAPESFRPLEGVAHMMATQRWYAVYKGARQSAPRLAYAAAGIQVVPLGAVELHDSDEGIAGSVTIPGGTRLSWQAARNAPPWPALGVHHEVLGRDQEGRGPHHPGAGCCRPRCLAGAGPVDH